MPTRGSRNQLTEDPVEEVGDDKVPQTQTRRSQRVKEKKRESPVEHRTKPYEHYIDG